jgi:anti-sigma factor RsiW
MFDCANVQMRELLPELAAGTLDAATRSRLERHVASCAECASELETLRLVRSAYRTAPSVDVNRIVASLPKRSTPERAVKGGAPVRRWMDWRIAAALTMITVGGLSVALLRRGPAETRVQPKDPVLAAAPIDSGRIAPAPATNPPLVAPSTKRIDSTNQAVSPAPRTPVASPKEQLAFSGGADDLDEATFRALLGALDEIDRAPVAPSAEPDRTPVLPVISKEGTR